MTRLGHILDALFAANLNTVFSAVALKALEVYAIPTPWLHQDTTTIALYGAYEDEPQTPGAPRPVYGHSKDGRADLKQVLLSLGVSGDGGVPLRLGVRDGNRSDSVETPWRLKNVWPWAWRGVRGIVADSKAYSRRTGGCVSSTRSISSRSSAHLCRPPWPLRSLGPTATCVPPLAREAWADRKVEAATALVIGLKRTPQVEVEYVDGRIVQEALRFVVVHSSQLAQQQSQAYAAAQAKEARSRGRPRAVRARPVVRLSVMQR